MLIFLSNIFDYFAVNWTVIVTDDAFKTGEIIKEKSLLTFKPKAEKWTRVNYTPVMATQYNIANLIEDFTYEFRVIAVNEAGEGKPSAVSSRVVVKDPKGEIQGQVISTILLFSMKQKIGLPL